MKDLGLDSCSLMTLLLCFIPLHISSYAFIQLFIHLGMLSQYNSTIIMSTIPRGLYLPQMREDALMLTGIKPGLDCLLWSALRHSISFYILTALEWLKSNTRKNNLYILVEILLWNVHMHQQPDLSFPTELLSFAYSLCINICKFYFCIKCFILTSRPLPEAFNLWPFLALPHW